MKLRKKQNSDIDNTLIEDIAQFEKLITVSPSTVEDIPVVIATTEIRKGRRKLKRKGNQPTLVNYFTAETQARIIDYQNETDPDKKKIIYIKDIMPAFDSLIENLINSYGFSVIHEKKKDLKSECQSFLYTAVEKFNAEKGSKAFSYFNVVAKNWLTIKSKQSNRRVHNYIAIDDTEHHSKEDAEQIEKYNYLPPNYEENVIKTHEYLTKIVSALEGKIKTDNERQVINAIKVLIENLEDIDLLSKRAILIYVKELTNLSSKQLSLCLSLFKKHYREIKLQEEFAP